MRQILGGMLIATALAIYALALANTAWMCDDAYISFRSADNLIHGFGLTWNIDERVQVFTNPLWTLLNGRYSPAMTPLSNRAMPPPV